MRPVTLTMSIIIMASTMGAVFAQSGGDYEIIKSAIGGGGGTCSGGDYSLKGTVGQANTGILNGGDYSLNGGFWSPSAGNSGCPCTTVADCRNATCADDNACNHASCMSGTCAFTCERYGDVQPPGGNGVVNLDDILCVLGGFANFTSCSNADIYPCSGNAVVSLDDILAALGAFAGANPCSCTENSAPGTGSPVICGSNQP